MLGAMSLSDARRPARRPLIRRLMLRDFRSYESLDARFAARLVALTGENGAGKTNLLEALSMFSPGRGLRRAESEDCARHGGTGGFSVSIELETEGHAAQLGQGYETGEGRRFRLDRLPVSSARAFADRLQVVWLTPAMDGLFAGPAGDRRRFLDRLTLGVDPEHGARVSKFEQALRGRNRLLEDASANARWLSAAEQEIAALGVAVASARLDTAQRLQALIDSTRDEASLFPHAVVALQGELETMLAELPVIAVEEKYRETLAQSRRRDAAAGRALVGPQTSDLLARHGPKDAPARDCSTGEQKALLVGLVLAQARLLANLRGIAPLVLLDEIAAHFDAKRREALYDELERLGSQVFMTGADPALFENLTSRAEIFLVTPCRLEALR